MDVWFIVETARWSDNARKLKRGVRSSWRMPIASVRLPRRSASETWRRCCDDTAVRATNMDAMLF